MNHFNYRIIKYPNGYTIHKVYYDDNGTPVGITEKPTIDFFCDTTDQIMEELDLIKKSIINPPLDIMTFKKDGP